MKNSIFGTDNRQLLNKVPAVTLAFWAIKIMSTTVGETGADFLIFNVHLGLTVTSAIMAVLLLAALHIQIKSEKYSPWIYWLAVVMVSIVGTLITDNLTDNLNVPLEASTLVFSLMLAIIFAGWYAKERTLSIHTINTPKREICYWTAILITFALGTAAGDLFSESLGFGYLMSGLIFGLSILAVIIAHYGFKLNSVLAFWLAYILTRPFGASVGDFLSQPSQAGGLGLGTTYTSIAFLMIILGLVYFLGRKENKRSHEI